MSTAVLVAVAAVWGLMIGSFLNVVVWRVPRRESVVSPRSRCPGCGTEIAPRDNVPVVSWLLLRGRCRHCSARISARYPLVELLTAVLFAAVTAVVGPRVALVGFLGLTAVAVALAFIDLDTKRLPNVLTYPLYPLGIVTLGLDAVVTGDWDVYLRALLGMVVLFAFYFLLVVVYPAGMGGGDVKLAGALGLFLGWFGWGALVVGAFLGFLVGGLFGVALMAARRGGRKTAIPYGPFMLLGAFAGFFVGEPLADLYLGALG